MRLIDADKLHFSPRFAWTTPDREEMIPVLAIDKEWVDKAPTVDAVEVVHAYWTGSRFNPMTDEYEEYCSHCCAWSPEYGKPYCPNCGAKMDGGNEDV